MKRRAATTAATRWRQLEAREGAGEGGRRLNELFVFVSFSEISYLQLTFLDLSGNRITVLPVELRFMTTVVHLNLEENPLSCPPANVRSQSECQESPRASHDTHY